jgi:hypothetical protein
MTVHGLVCQTLKLNFQFIGVRIVAEDVQHCRQSLEKVVGSLARRKGRANYSTTKTSLSISSFL